MGSPRPGQVAIDIAPYPDAKQLVEHCKAFIAEIQNLTPGADMEQYLNTQHGPGTKHYDAFSTAIRSAITTQQPWCAAEVIDGQRYRISKLYAPGEETCFFSITTVYMSGVEPYRGRYHQHPYGEINCVIPLDESAELKGPLGWRGKGWTCPGPGSRHFPEVRGGALVALFFLPAGRISFDVTPDGESLPAGSHKDVT